MVTGTNQTHDFDGDIEPFPNGVFWTVRIPSGSVAVDLSKATASLHVSNLAIPDYFTAANALNLLGQGPSVPATVSYDVEWSGVLGTSKERNLSEGYVGDFIHDTATLAWSATESGFSFVSHAANTSTSMFAQIGRERNERFFS